MTVSRQLSSTIEYRVYKAAFTVFENKTNNWTII